MSLFLWGLACGGILAFLIQTLACLLILRRHKVATALIERAQMYHDRAKAYAAAGKTMESARCWAECQTLLAQVEELRSTAQQKGAK